MPWRIHLLADGDGLHEIHGAQARFGRAIDRFHAIIAIDLGKGVASHHQGDKEGNNLLHGRNLIACSRGLFGRHFPYISAPQRIWSTVLLLIDNYDSFTYNLVHFLGDLGARCVVHRNDQITVDEAMALKPDAIVLSPGPCTPNEAGICMDLVKAAAKAQVPLLGVCLGHQAIGQVFGGKVVRAPAPMHGKLSGIEHKGQSVFEDVPSPFEATRYHSLIVERASFPKELEVTAETGDIVMGLRHKTLPIHGVQFHPESIASQHGHKILENFLKIAGEHPSQQKRAA